MRAILIVESRPVDPNCENEYNDWYDNVHVAEVCEIPGFVSARRYRRDEETVVPSGGVAYPYVAVYEIDSDDPPSVIAELRARVQDGRIPLHKALELDPKPRMTLWNLRP